MRLILLRGPVCLVRAVLPRRARPVFSSRPPSSEGFTPLRRPTGRNPTKLTNAELVRGFGNTRSRSHSRSAPSSPTVVVASSISPSNSVPCHLPWGSTADRSAQVYSTSLSPPAQLVCLFFRDLSVMGRAKRRGVAQQGKSTLEGPHTFQETRRKNAIAAPTVPHHFPSESNGSCQETKPRRFPHRNVVANPICL